MEARTDQTNAAMSQGKPPRQLDPWAAFMMSLVGLGFLYVGRFRLLLWLILSAFAFTLLLSWTRWVFLPAGIYALLAAMLLSLLLAVFLPTYIAWREKTAPVKFYNRWYFYVGWMIATSLIVEFVYLPNRDQLYGYALHRASSESMSPTLGRGDIFVVDTRRYDEHKPVVSEIAIFETPEGYSFVKRIVGVPHDRIEIRHGKLLRNGVPVDEAYLRPQLEGERFGRDVPPITLAAGEYYLLGDFRDQSRDSRTFGPISAGQLIGRAEYSVFPRRRLAPPLLP